jgi:hypothetical protein
MAHAYAWGKILCSRSGAHEAAAGLSGRAAFAAKRAIFRLVARDGKIEQSLILHGELNSSPAAVDERSGTHDPASCLFDNPHSFQCRAPGSPNVFNDEDVLVWTQREPAAQGHRAAGIALNENSGDTADTSFHFRQSAGYFVADDNAAKRWGNYGVDVRIRKEGGEGTTEPFRVVRILQRQGALRVSAAVQTAAELEMAVADGSRGFKHPDYLFA